MTEASQVNDAVRRHLGPLGSWRRVEHAYEAGWPDWYYRARGVAGWLEAKLFKGNACPLSREQLLWAMTEARHGGLWHVLALRVRDRTWALFNLGGAIRWNNGTAPQEVACLWIQGPFPRQQLFQLLAPR